MARGHRQGRCHYRVQPASDSRFSDMVTQGPLLVPGSACARHAVFPWLQLEIPLTTDVARCSANQILLFFFVVDVAVGMSVVVN